jgi:hypothetical protein
MIWNLGKKIDIEKLNDLLLPVRLPALELSEINICFSLGRKA